jgi:hypothetical protein
MHLLGTNSARNLLWQGRKALTGVVCAAGDDRSTAQRAGEWVQRFYPDIIVEIGVDGARISSPERDAATLRLTWRSALANEALLVRGASQRAAVIEALVT